MQQRVRLLDPSRVPSPLRQHRRSKRPRARLNRLPPANRRARKTGRQFRGSAPALRSARRATLRRRATGRPAAYPRVSDHRDRALLSVRLMPSSRELRGSDQGSRRPGSRSIGCAPSLFPPAIARRSLSVGLIWDDQTLGRDGRSRRRQAPGRLHRKVNSGHQDLAGRRARRMDRSPIAAHGRLGPDSLTRDAPRQRATRAVSARVAMVPVVLADMVPAVLAAMLPAVAQADDQVLARAPEAGPQSGARAQRNRAAPAARVRVARKRNGLSLKRMWMGRRVAAPKLMPHGQRPAPLERDQVF
jgi:hypothetical protein